MMKNQGAEKKDIAIEKTPPMTTPTPMPPSPSPSPPSSPIPNPILERMSSLDSEPKTLLQDELKSAREEALKILTTHTKEEALKIFLAGLVPVASSKQTTEEAIVCDSDDE